ncbi:MAG TPA: tetratricopeptide repeat protein [Dokdonella sp.]|uniref:tetratricopeptide repeat protein n=2 Tax=Dokdonella sp. TaxID=2291710 RepID=UPI002BCDBD3D|nr:tetratricopeptide repeat protein [Dokdonella sp.]HOX72163.1 tetratricopeptide repeat protein [Dokdonella sp.]
MGKAAKSVAWVIVLSAIAITTSIYWIGLRGGFVYDDFSFVVGNAGIKVTLNNLQQWFAAIVSFPSGAHQGRWLGMLSFAFNHYFTGMDPFWFKLTNLVIHLLNGLLVFLALRALFRFHHANFQSSAKPSFNPAMVAACIAALWLVLPINLTAVLYVTQRLESLSNTFVLLGFWLYLRARITEIDGPRKTIFIWVCLIAATGLGAMVKESGILLPLYTALVEFVLTGFRLRDGRWNRRLLVLYSTLLALPLIAGLFWLGGWVDGTRSFGRSFDVPERLMTEARILFDYACWTLLPNLDALTLYHDDIQVSTGLLSPVTTLLSIFGIIVLLGVAFLKRRSMPLFALGVFLYFAGHVLTATVIPLLLAFEHRNYFPSIGLLLACVSLFVIEGFRLRPRTSAAIFLGAFSFYAFTTALRATEWSEPFRLAMTEAAKRPRSPGAQFARAYSLLSGKQRLDRQSVVETAFLSLDSARKLPGAGILFEQLLITSHAQRRLPLHQEWWDDLIAKLQSRPANASDARALHNLNACFLDNFCVDGLSALQRAYEAALSHGAPRPELLSVHAEFAWHLLGDKQQGEKDIRAAVIESPKDINARKNLIVLLIATNQLADAKKELDRLREQNWFGLFDNLINSLETALVKMQGAAGSSNRSLDASPQTMSESGSKLIALPVQDEPATETESTK